jgi:hypothetical protein
MTVFFRTSSIFSFSPRREARVVGSTPMGPTAGACGVAPRVAAAFAWGSAFQFGRDDDCSTPSMGVDDEDGSSKLPEEVTLGVACLFPSPHLRMTGGRRSKETAFFSSASLVLARRGFEVNLLRR